MSWKKKRKENIRGERVPSIEEIRVHDIVFLKTHSLGVKF